MLKKGYFITLEGVDGCGKSSVALKLKEKLVQLGYTVCHTREPGGIEIAEKIREIILDPKHLKMSEKTEALLYAASRSQHLKEKVIPALKRNEIIICERFLDSSLAYQGYARNLGIAEVLKINQFAIDNYFPELTIYLDVDVKVGLSRLEKRDFKDRLDSEKLDFHLKVKQGYEVVNQMFDYRIKYVDASKSLDEVVDASLNLILELING